MVVKSLGGPRCFAPVGTPFSNPPNMSLGFPAPTFLFFSRGEIVSDAWERPLRTDASQPPSAATNVVRAQS